MEALWVIVAVAVCWIAATAIQRYIAYRLQVAAALQQIAQALSALLDNAALLLGSRVAQLNAAQRATREDLPLEIQQWAARESEPWAQESVIARARELFAEYDDGVAEAKFVWGKVLNRLQQEEALEM